MGARRELAAAEASRAPPCARPPLPRNARASRCCTPHLRHRSRPSRTRCSKPRRRRRPHMPRTVPAGSRARPPGRGPSRAPSPAAAAEPWPGLDSRGGRGRGGRTRPPGLKPFRQCQAVAGSIRPDTACQGSQASRAVSRVPTGAEQFAVPRFRRGRWVRTRAVAVQYAPHNTSTIANDTSAAVAGHRGGQRGRKPPTGPSACTSPCKLDSPRLLYRWLYTAACDVRAIERLHRLRVHGQQGTDEGLGAIARPDWSPRPSRP